MSEVKLRPNDRIQIGPSALFLYKNVGKDHEASRPDTEEDPITFDFASEEVRIVDEGQNEEEIAAAKKQAAETQQAIDDINKRAKEEAEKAKEEANKLDQEADLLELGTDEDKEKAATIKAMALQKRRQIDQDTAKKVQVMMADELRKRQLQEEYLKIKEELGHLLPQINEANLAA